MRCIECSIDTETEVCITNSNVYEKDNRRVISICNSCREYHVDRIYHTTRRPFNYSADIYRRSWTSASPVVRTEIVSRLKVLKRRAVTDSEGEKHYDL